MKAPTWPATGRPAEAQLKEGRGRDPGSLALQVKKEAARLGFLAAGITVPEFFQRRRPELERWLSRGHSGGISYMESFFARQAEMLAAFPHTRSIVMLAAAYGPAPAQSQEKTGPSGRVARYAQGRDYHRAVRKRIRHLERFIRTSTGAQTRHCIDKGPLQERALAEAAGIGFVGKNTLLIRPGSGSFFFLAALLTDLPLAPDRPLAWDCGSCTLCLEACPTGALVAPYQLDAGLCISNLTIENRGPIPERLRPLMGDWLFGCDICQEVCPYNRAKEPARWVDFEPESGNGPEIPLAALLGLQEAQFESYFTGTPLRRPGRSGLLRNAAVAAGNLRDRKNLPALLKSLKTDPAPIVRAHSAWAIGKIAGIEARQGLQEALETERDPQVLQEIRQAIA